MLVQDLLKGFECGRSFQISTDKNRFDSRDVRQEHARSPDQLKCLLHISSQASGNVT